jgi:hypothetical protein
MDGFDFNQTGYKQNQTDRAYNYAPPVYSPFQNPGNVDNAFGYIANMYGPALVQGMAGPDAFLAHQTPSQALADQRTASIYQQQGVRATNAANMSGNQAVARRMLGFQSLMNGGRPATQLDREHAQVGASVVNNPVFKAFAASQVGAENLEDMMFGRRGDPSAIAGSTGRMGFFRADAATGDRRMSEASRESFSQNVYQNLYGPNANLDAMHGFNATASGAMMEDLFQKGKLPQSLGNMTAAERVRAISGAQRDDKTMGRLADEFAHRDLSERDYDYANATAEEQTIIRKDKVGGYKDRLNKTFTEIDRFKSGDSRAKSAEEIEQLEGFGSAANAVDAQRTSKAIKEYNGALSAIREIFGDSGQSGAPVQQLMASLQQLTNGSQGGLSQGKVESLVREMRLAARDTNTDVGALTKMMYEDKAIGDQLGLQETTVEQGMAGRLLHGQAMSDAGVFEKSGFGKLQRGEAEQRQRQMSMRGDASSVGRSLAVINRLVAENPEKYAGTKLEAAAKAYQAGETNFTYNGEKTNLAELAGKQGVAGIYNMARESGADSRTLYAYTRDKIGTEEYLNEGYAYKAQKYELQRNFSRSNEGALRDRMTSAEFNSLQGSLSDKEFSQRKNDLSKGFSYAMTGIVMDETADMSSEQRIAHMEKRGKEELTKYFKSSRGGNMGDRAAQAAAEKHFNAMYGADKKERASSLAASYAEISAVSADRTNVNIEANKQMYNQRAIENKDAQAKVNTRRADRLKDASAGTESTLLQRASDELENLGAGNSGQAADALKRVFNIVSEDSILQKYAPDMQEGLVAVAKMDRSATTSAKDISSLVDQAEADPNGAAAKTLKQMAGFKPDQQLTDEEQASLGNRALMRSGETAKGTTDADRAANEARRQRATTMFKAFNTGKQEDVLAGARALAKETLGADADKDKLEEFAKSALNADTTEFEKKMQGGLFGGKLSDEKQESARSVARALRASRASGGLSAAGLEQTAQGVDAAQERSVAKANEVTRDIRDKITKQVEKGLDQPAFDKIQPDNQPADVRANQRKEFVRNASETLAGIAVNEMGSAENLSPEERADYMQRRATEEFTKHFTRKGMVPARAEEQAKKHFEAAFGSDKETVTRRMNAVYDTTLQEAKARGHDAALAATPEPAQVDPVTGKLNYDYEKLGVTKTLSAEQKKLMDEVSKDPTGGGLSEAIGDKKKRELLLTIPDAAAVDLFGKFTPEAQQKGLENIDTLRNSPLAQMTYGLSGKDTQNLGRLRDAIGAKAPGGLSSQNIDPAAAINAAGLRAEDIRAASGNADVMAMGMELFGSDGYEKQMKQLETTAVDGEMAQLYDTKAKSGWFTKEKTFSDNADKIRYRDLSQRRMELESGDELGFVDSQIADVKGRAKSGWFTKDKTLSGEDQEQLDFLTKRRDSLTRGEGEMRAGLDAVQSSRDSIKDSQQFSSMRSDQVVRQLDYNRDRGDPQMGGGQGGREMSINGTLTLNGLSEAVLQASGKRMEETPDGGAPIDMAPGNTAYNGR